MTDREIARMLLDPAMRSAFKTIIKEALREVLEDERRAARGERADVRHFGNVPL